MLISDPFCDPTSFEFLSFRQIWQRNLKDTLTWYAVKTGRQEGQGNRSHSGGKVTYSTSLSLLDTEEFIQSSHIKTQVHSKLAFYSAYKYETWMIRSHHVVSRTAFLPLSLSLFSSSLWSFNSLSWKTIQKTLTYASPLWETQQCLVPAIFIGTP